MRVFGLDLSRKMMRRLIETLPPGAPAPALVEADAVDLPFAPAEFDAAVSVHVFHLLADWRAALAEARRILKPDGIVLTGYEWRPPDSASERLLTAWKDIVRAKGLDPGHRPGAGDFEEIKSELFAMGAAMDEWSAGEWETRRTIAHHIETIEHRTWSSTWGVPDDFFPQCLAELRAWAVSQFGALDREFVAPRRFVWQRFRWG
jgi:SAM-dependent methyltransferase